MSGDIKYKKSPKNLNVDSLDIDTSTQSLLINIRINLANMIKAAVFKNSPIAYHVFNMSTADSKIMAARWTLHDKLAKVVKFREEEVFDQTA